MTAIFKFDACLFKRNTISPCRLFMYIEGESRNTAKIQKNIQDRIETILSVVHRKHNLFFFQGHLFQTFQGRRGCSSHLYSIIDIKMNSIDNERRHLRISRTNLRLTLTKIISSTIYNLTLYIHSFIVFKEDAPENFTEGCNNARK